MGSDYSVYTNKLFFIILSDMRYLNVLEHLAMGHHLLSDYSRLILWVKLHLWQFIKFQLYSSLE